MMSSDQKAIIALINRGRALSTELNDMRRANRELERQLDEAQARIAELEARPAARAAAA
jgi:chromosome segregation ATPase